VKNQIQGVETSQSFISDKYENVIEVPQSIKKEMKTVQSYCKESKERLECLEKETSYNMAMLDEVIQQYLRRDCLEITGIPIVPLDDPSTLVSEVCSAMDIELQEDDIYQLLTGFLQQQSLKTELL
jgi:predicted nuclease with TOPRIM domain